MGGGGKGGSSQNVYYADCAYVMGIGPLQRLYAIRTGDTTIWESTYGLAISSDVTSLTTDLGSCRVYRGTETQPADSLLAGHPAYRGQIVVVFNQLKLGMETTTLPSCSIDARCGSMSSTDYVNPVAACRSVHTNTRYGLGASADTFPSTSFESVKFAAPKLKDGRSASEIYDELCNINFCKPRWVGRKVEIVRQFEAPDWDAAPLIDASNRLSWPVETPETPDELVSQTQVRWTDNNGEEDQECVSIFTDPAAEAGGKTLSIDAQDITLETYATQYAIWRGHEGAVPYSEGEVSCRKSVGRGIKPGDPFRFTDADGNEVRAWCTSRTIARDEDRVDLEWEIDRTGSIHDSAAPIGYKPPAYEVGSPVDPAAVYIFEAPRPWSLAPAAAILCARGSDIVGGYAVYMSRDNGANFEFCGLSEAFTTVGYLGSDISASAVTLSVVDIPRDADGIETVSSEQADADTNFAIVTDGTAHEIISVQDVEQLGGGAVTLGYCRRGRVGTAPRAWSAGATVHMIPRLLIPIVQGIILAPSPVIDTAEHPSDAAEYLIRLPQRVLGKIQAVDDCDDYSIDIVETSRRPIAPDGIEPESLTDWDESSDIEVSLTTTIWRDEGYPSADFFERSELQIVPVIVGWDGRHVLDARAAVETEITITAAEVADALGDEDGYFTIEYFTFYEGRHSATGISMLVASENMVYDTDGTPVYDIDGTPVKDIS